MMEAAGTIEAAALLRDFQFVDPTWDGTAFVPFWGRELEVSIDPDDDGITRRQLKVLRAVLNHSKDLRPEFEQALFAYYQADVSGAPKLTKPAQVMRLIDDPVVMVPSYFRTKTAVEFSLSFNCEWDPEHGLEVHYRNWRPVEFGGWDL